MKKYILILAPLLVLSNCDFQKGSRTSSSQRAATRQPTSIVPDGRIVTRGPASSPEAKLLHQQAEDEIKTGKCFSEVDERIKRFRAERTWSRGPSGLDGSSVFVSPTSLPGRWVRVVKFMNGELQFSVLTKNQTEIYNFSKTCSFTRDIRSRPYGRVARNDGLELFTDESLIELIENTSAYGVIYLWSPGMGYSYQRAVDRSNAYVQTDDLGRAVSGISNVTEAARNVRDKLGVTMTVTMLVDPFCRKEQAERALKTPNNDLKQTMLRRAAAFDILMRSMGQHFPSVMVYGNGKIYRQIQPGLSTAEQYRQFIETAVLALKKN